MWLAGIDFTKLQGDTNYESGYDAVRRLKFPFFSRFPHAQLPQNTPNSDIVLMSKCKNLQDVTLHFHDTELVIAWYDEEYFESKTISQLRQEYRLDDIFTLPSLRNLQFGIQNLNPWKDTERSMAGNDALSDLLVWFKAEFKRRGMSVNIY